MGLMKKIAGPLLIGGAVLMFSACGGKSATAPTATPSVTSIAVSGASTSSSTFQLSATAQISDGSTRDVTASAVWLSSDASLATVSSIGAVTITGTGDVEFRATYQSVTGTLRLLVGKAPVPPPTSFVLSGTVREAGTALVVARARVAVSDGSGAAAFVLSDANGRFSFPNIAAGTIALDVTKDGYLTPMSTIVLMSEDTNLDVFIFATVPLDATGAPATARCEDGSWSWAQTRAEACVAQGGIAYPTCPGPVCFGVAPSAFANGRTR